VRKGLANPALGKRNVADYYSALARGYEELYGEEQLTKLREAEEHIGLQPCDIVLDLGCGTGLLSREVAQMVRDVVGLDISREMLRVGGQWQRVLGDAENLPFRDGVFDKVLCFTVLQNLEHPQAALEQVRRVCRGVVAVSVHKRLWARERLVGLFEEFFSLSVVAEGERDWVCVGKPLHMPVGRRRGEPGLGTDL